MMYNYFSIVRDKFASPTLQDALVGSLGSF